MKIENYVLEGEMLPIYTYPEPVLAQVAKNVEVFDERLEKLVKDMLYTMYHAPGIGLAAPQVGISERLFVVDVEYDREEIEEANGNTRMEFSNLSPMVFINPVFSKKEGSTIFKEGCLSVPEVYEEVTRSERVLVEYQDLKGNHCSLEADELLAICLQHENDHLDGIVFIDRLSPLKKKFFKTKLIKEKKRI
jgi:peptide deformylase